MNSDEEETKKSCVQSLCSGFVGIWFYKSNWLIRSIDLYLGRINKSSVLDCLSPCPHPKTAIFVLQFVFSQVLLVKKTKIQMISNRHSVGKKHWTIQRELSRIYIQMYISSRTDPGFSRRPHPQRAAAGLCGQKPNWSTSASNFPQGAGTQTPRPE